MTSLPPAVHDAITNLSDYLARLAGAIESSEPQTAAALLRLVEVLHDETARIAFGGRFDNGKSTLVNALLGRDVLPCGMFKETGASYVVSAGTADQAIVTEWDGSGDGHRSYTIPCTTEALRAVASLLTPEGDDNPRAARVRDLRVTLTDVAVPAGTHWIDSPGIDDSWEMEARARTVASAADVLTWVFSSRQQVTEREVDFLAEHIAQRGSAGVVFVLNAFLEPDDSPVSWDTFVEQVAPRLMRRLDNQASRMGLEPAARPPVLVTSGRALAGATDGRTYGAAAMRAFFGALAGPQAAAVQAARLARVARALGRLAREQHAAHERQWQARLAEHAVAVAAAQRAHDAAAGRRAHFERAVEQAIARLLGHASTAAGSGAAAQTARVTVANAKAIKEWNRDLEHAIADAMPVRSLVADIASNATTWEQRPPSAGLEGELRHDVYMALLATIATPETEVPVAGAIFGGLVGGAAGLLAASVTGPFGVALGAKAGVELGKKVSGVKEAEERLMSEARNNLRSAAQSAASRLDSSKLRQTLLSRVMAQCAVAPEPVDVPEPRATGPALYQALEELAGHAQGLAERCWEVSAQLRSERFEREGMTP